MLILPNQKGESHGKAFFPRIFDEWNKMESDESGK